MTQHKCEGSWRNKFQAACCHQGSISPTHWRKVQIRHQTAFGKKKMLFSFTNKTAPKYTGALNLKLHPTCAVCQHQVQCKSTGGKAAHDMMVTLTPGYVKRGYQCLWSCFIGDPIFLLHQRLSGSLNRMLCSLEIIDTLARSRKKTLSIVFEVTSEEA